MEHRTVRSVATAEVPALHSALKTFALAHSGNVHKLANFEMIHQDSVARLGFILGVVDPKFANVSQRRHACFFEMSCQCFIDALRLDEFDEAQLRRVVAILVLRSPLNYP